jgi:hypothetical protein
MIKLAFATCLVACVGCISFERSGNTGPSHPFLNERTAAVIAATRADEAAGQRDITASASMTYWMGLKEALHQVPIDSEVAAKDIRNLPTKGVDPDLVRECQLAAEKMQAASESIYSMPVYTILFHLPFSRWLEAEARGKAAMEQCYLVEQMRPELSVRYGVEFPPLDVPKH